MMQRKGIVMLITLFFITAISLLIFQNLDFTEKMLSQSQKEDEMIQMQLSIQNIKEEITGFVYKKKKELGNILPVNNFELHPSEKVYINIKKIDTYNNKINIYKQKLSEELSYFLKDITITNNKQLRFVLGQYLKSFDDGLIEEQKENFSYFDTNSNKFIYCSFELNVNSSKSNGEFIFNSDTKEVVDFELVLKK